MPVFPFVFDMRSDFYIYHQEPSTVPVLAKQGSLTEKQQV